MGEESKGKTGVQTVLTGTQRRRKMEEVGPSPAEPSHHGQQPREESIEDMPRLPSISLSLQHISLPDLPPPPTAGE